MVSPQAGPYSDSIEPVINSKEFVMFRKILPAVVFSLAAVVLAGENGVFSAGSGGVVRVENIVFRLCHWGRGWKNGTVQNPANPSFPGEGGNIRTGAFKVFGGAFTYEESLDFSRSGEVSLSLSLSNPDGIETESLVLAADLPLKLLKGRPVLFNEKKAGFGDVFDKSNAVKRIRAKKRENSVVIPLNGGVLKISGDFSAQLQDDRKYKKQSYGFRLLFAGGSGKLKQARLVLKMTYLPYVSVPLDLSAAANRAFRDDHPDDRNGSWNDQGPENDLRMLPSGLHKWGGLNFRILDHAESGGRTCIALKGRNRPFLPESAAVPGDGRTGNFLYLLNALGWEPLKETPVGEIIVGYADGSRDVLPVVSGVDTANFWNPREIRNGTAVWRGENDCATVCLYASKFKLSGKRIGRITFRSAGYAVWMIAAATLSDEDIVPEIRGPVVFKANMDWRPVKNLKDIVPGSIIDFSDMLDKPAGKYGFLKVSGGHFEFEKRPGKPVRFWGINNAGDTNFMDSAMTDRMLDELAAAGYNLVRLHHFDGKLADRKNGTSTSLDPVRMDRMDYQLAECRKRGIYTTLDLFTARTLEKGEIPEFPGRAVTAQEFKALAFLNENVMRNLETFAANLLNHVNPYTGLAWKNDPSIINISLINEDTLSQTVNRSPFVRELYEKAFEKYIGNNKVTLADSNGNQHFQRFLAETYLRGWNRLSGFVRSLGVKVPLTDMNYINDIPSTLLRNRFDFVDTHSYWGHPQFLGSNWSLPAAVNPESAIPNYAGGISALFRSRIFGKPFAVTEWDHVNPNPFAVEGAFLAGAYAALQDYSELCRFDYAWTPEKVRSEDSHLCFFDIANDPLRLLSERAGVLFFLRGDVAVSKSSYPVCVNPDALKLPGYPKYYPQTVTRIGLIGKTGNVFNAVSIPADSKAVLTLMPEKIDTALPAILCRSARDAFDELLKTGAVSKKEYDPAAQKYTSSTGELVLNRKEKSFLAVTPRSEGFAAPAGVGLTGSFAAVRNRDAFGAVLVASRDGRPLAESGRILILHLTNLKNTGMRFSNPEMSVLERYGTLPLLMRRGEAEITLNVSAGMKLFACAFNGERKFEVKTTAGNGKLSFIAKNITPHGAIAVYELVKE